MEAFLTTVRALGAAAVAGWLTIILLDVERRKQQRVLVVGLVLLLIGLLFFWRA